MTRIFKIKKEAQDYADKITSESYGTPTRKLRKIIKKVKAGYAVYVYASGIKYRKSTRNKNRVEGRK